MSKENEIRDLYNGYVVAIDEAIGIEGDRINQILAKVEDRGIPICKYPSLPANSRFFENLRSIGFIILDWDLNSSPAIEQEIQLGDALKAEAFNANIDFLKKIKESCLAPVFIFTNDPESATKWLVDHGDGIYDSNNENRNFILVRNKKSVSEEDTLFETIENWIKSNPSIYTLKKWESNFFTAKNSTFSELYGSSSIWPTVLWSAFNDDSVDEGSSIDEIIYRNIKGRGKLLELDPKIIRNIPDDENPSTEEIRSLITNSQFVSSENLPENDLQPGDIFEGERNNEFYINIRPICDTVIGRDTCDGISYCLKGKKMSGNSVRKSFQEKYGYISQRANEYIVFGVNKELFVSFSLSTLHQFEFAKIKSKRIQRLLPPHITDLQQKYASYIGRIGLPRTLKEIIPEPPAQE